MSISFNFERPKPGKTIYDKGVYPPQFNRAFKTRIRRRDGFVCASCRRRRRLDVHHINYTKYTVAVNCISLCRSCHIKVHADLSPTTRTAWATKFYRLACLREGVKTERQLREAWRLPDEP